jgi:hypothetical protein
VAGAAAGASPAALLAAGLAALLAGCTPSSGGVPVTPSPTVRTDTVTRTQPPPPAPDASPIDTGPTSAATASRCPFLDQQSAAHRVGMRLAKITVLRSGGAVVGCRFYALQHPTASCDETCLRGEHLPGPSQPAVEIETFEYRSAIAAHNGFVRRSEAAGTNLERASLVGQAPGLCFQTHFYPKDGGTDWACAFSKGRTVAIVRTVVTSPALTAILVAREVSQRV